MKLLGGLGSPYLRKVAIVMEEKGVAYVLAPMRSIAPEVAAANPLGKIPVLVLDSGRALYDSPVIVEYADGLKPEKRLIPLDFEGRIEVLRWQALADGVMDATVDVSHEDRFPEGFRRGPDWIEKQRGKMERGVAQMAGDLGGRDFCHGNALTLADIAVGVALFYIDRSAPEFDWRKAHPNLAALARRLEERPSFRKTVPPPP